MFYTSNIITEKRGNAMSVVASSLYFLVNALLLSFAFVPHADEYQRYGSDEKGSNGSVRSIKLLLKEGEDVKLEEDDSCYEYN